MNENIFNLDIQECEYLFYQGDKLMLFEAVRRCAQYGIPMPDWIKIELGSGLSRYYKHEVKNFGDAFGISRGRGYHQNAKKRNQKRRLVFGRGFNHCTGMVPVLILNFSI